MPDGRTNNANMRARLKSKDPQLARHFLTILESFLKSNEAVSGELTLLRPQELSEFFE